MTLDIFLQQVPDGDGACGYEFIAPLDDGGRLDAAAWRANRARCTVRERGNERDFGCVLGCGTRAARLAAASAFGTWHTDSKQNTFETQTWYILDCSE